MSNRLANYKIISGRTGFISFEWYERKDIVIDVGLPILYFNFSFCGNGFEFLMSADATYSSTKATIIALNHGYFEKNGTRHTVTASTDISWIAIVLC